MSCKYLVTTSASDSIFWRTRVRRNQRKRLKTESQRRSAIERCFKHYFIHCVITVTFTTYISMSTKAQIKDVFLQTLGVFVWSLYMQVKWSDDVRDVFANPRKTLGVYTEICYAPPVNPRCTNTETVMWSAIFSPLGRFMHINHFLLCVLGDL